MFGILTHVHCDTHAFCDQCFQLCIQCFVHAAAKLELALGLFRSIFFIIFRRVVFVGFGLFLFRQALVLGTGKIFCIFLAHGLGCFGNFFAGRLFTFLCSMYHSHELLLFFTSCFFVQLLVVVFADFIAGFLQHGHSLFDFVTDIVVFFFDLALTFVLVGIGSGTLWTFGRAFWSTTAAFFRSVAFGICVRTNTHALWINTACHNATSGCVFCIVLGTVCDITYLGLTGTALDVGCHLVPTFFNIVARAAFYTTGFEHVYSITVAGNAWLDIFGCFLQCRTGIGNVLHCGLSLVAHFTNGTFHCFGSNITQHFINFLLGAGNLVSKSDFVFGFSQSSK